MTGMEIPAIAAAAGSALSALGSFRQGQSDQAAARMNAQMQQQAGQNELLAGEAEAARLQDDGRRRNAAAFNALAGQGVDPSSGSAAALMDDLAAGSALDASIARWRGTQGAAARNQQATFLNWQGKQAMRAAELRAASTLLTAGGRLMGPGS
jgi:hypothetical protein